MTVHVHRRRDSTITVTLIEEALWALLFTYPLRKKYPLFSDSGAVLGRFGSFLTMRDHQTGPRER